MTYLPQQTHSPLKTLQEAILFYAVPQNCIETVIRSRWADGNVSCPTCGSEAVTWLPTRSLFQCKARHSKRQFSVKVGTIFEDSPLPLGKWLIIAWMLGSCRNGISSYEVARTIGITQKSAWFMLHRLREAMKMQEEPLFGEVEADETYVGAKLKNKHRSKLKQGTHKDKTPVFGMVERGGHVVAAVVPDAKEGTILPILAKSVAPESTLYTDSYPTYDKVRKMPENFGHYQINHYQDAYVVGPIHTNTIENFWSCLKRTLKGTYISVMPAHLMAYVLECCFRFNVRKGHSEEQRFSRVIEGITGKRLTYKALIARAA